MQLGLEYNKPMKVALIPSQKDEKWIYWTIIGLSVFSIIMVASASVGITPKQEDAVLYNMLRQLVYSALGYGLFLFFYNWFNLKRLRNLLPFLALLITLLLFATLLFPEINGAKAWIQLFGFSLQPSEFVKPFVIVFMAVYFPRFAARQDGGWEIIRWPALIFALWLGVIIILQTDIGTALVLILLTGVCILVVPGNAFRIYRALTKLFFLLFFSTLIFVLTPLGLKFVNILPLPEYQKLRFTAVLDPFSDIYDATFQIYNSLLAFAKGNIFGVGFGSSVQKFGYLPEARTDFIFPIIIEELGLIGFLIVFAGYGVMIYRLFSYSFRLIEPGEKIVLIGTIAYLFIHFALNIGGVSALIPMTGIPLLLISSGGSSTLSIMIMLGISLNIINKQLRR